jgi:hypothetical protein
LLKTEREFGLVCLLFLYIEKLKKKYSNIMVLNSHEVCPVVVTGVFSLAFLGVAATNGVLLVKNADQTIKVRIHAYIRR